MQNFWYPQLHCTVHGVEYAFGAHDYPTSGVFEVEPRQCPGFKFRKSIFIGTTCLDPIQVREFMERQSASYNGDTYHLIAKNCNHFCKDICYTLTGKQIPKWVNRLAKIGNSFLIPLLDTLVLLVQNFVQNFINKHFEFKNLLVSTKIGPLLNFCPIMVMPPIQSRGDRFCHKRPSIFLIMEVLMKDLLAITASQDFAISALAIVDVFIINVTWTIVEFSTLW